MSLLTFIENTDQCKEEDDESDYAETARAELELNIHKIHHYIRRPEPPRNETRNETMTRNDTEETQETDRDDFVIYQSNLQALEAYYSSGIIDAEYEFWLLFDVSEYESTIATRWATKWGDGLQQGQQQGDNNKDI